jgi:hypothetical protein
MITVQMASLKRTSAPTPATPVKGEWPGPALDDFQRPAEAADCW